MAGWLSLAGSGAAREVSGVEDAVAGSSPLMVIVKRRAKLTPILPHLTMLPGQGRYGGI